LNNQQSLPGTESQEPIKKKTENKGQLREWGEALIFALILALIIRAFLIQAYRIPSSSMEDTLLKGDHILATKYNYGVTVPFATYKIFGSDIIPKRGDVIIFTFPQNHEMDFVKRVVGLPGDTVAIINKKVFINGKEYVQGHEKYTDPLIVDRGISVIRDNMPETLIKKGNIFVMGDNRDQSYDSRFWGQLPLENVKGKALIIYFSWDSNNFFNRLLRIGHIIK
jgi:signal peptidase I